MLGKPRYRRQSGWPELRMKQKSKLVVLTHRDSQLWLDKNPMPLMTIGVSLMVIVVRMIVSLRPMML